MNIFRVGQLNKSIQCVAPFCLVSLKSWSMVWTLPADNHMRITWVTKHRRLLAKRRARSRVLRKPRALKLRRMVKHLDQQQEDQGQACSPTCSRSCWWLWHASGRRDFGPWWNFTSFYIVLGECLGDRLTVSGLHRSCRVSHWIARASCPSPIFSIWNRTGGKNIEYCCRRQPVYSHPWMIQPIATEVPILVAIVSWRVCFWFMYMHVIIYMGFSFPVEVCEKNGALKAALTCFGEVALEMALLVLTTFFFEGLSWSDACCRMLSPLKLIRAVQLWFYFHEFGFLGLTSFKLWRFNQACILFLPPQNISSFEV